jgi:predicted ATP-grasp superfamily ATP-dependent carboligase
MTDSNTNTNLAVLETTADSNDSPGGLPAGHAPASGNGVNQSGKGRQVDVLVTNGWGRVAYNIVRSLGRKGLTVALGTDEFLGMGLLSRYTAASFRHPSVIRQTLGFLASLKEAFRTFSPRVYLPSDQEVMVAAKYRDELDEFGIKIPIAPFATLRMLHLKDALQRLAASLGVPTPETIVPKNLDEVRAFVREFGDPVVVKRLSSSSGRGLSYTSREELLAADGPAALRGLRFGEFLVQEHVGGASYGVSMLFNHGELRAKFTHKRLRERAPRGGVSTLRLSVQNRLLEEYAESLLRHAGFHGVAMVEFKYDEARKQAWLLEVNPRFWGSLGLAVRSGVDFPYLLYKMALEGDVEPVLDYRSNVQCRWILGDAYTLLRQMGRNGHRPSDSAQAPIERVSDDFDWRDPLPFVGEFAFSAWKSLRTLGSRPADADLSPDCL